MTLKELKESNEGFVTAADIAPVLRVDPQCIRRQAQTNPAALGFPVCVLGRQCKISRLGFLRFVEGVNKPIDYKEKS